MAKTGRKKASKKSIPKPAKSKTAKSPSGPRKTSAVSAATLFTDIGTAFTLSAAAAKGSRKIKNADLSPIENAAILVEKGRIAWIGPKAEIPAAAKRARRESLGGRNVIPGLVECHTHLVFAGNRAGEFERRNAGESYQSIGKSGGGILATVIPTREASEAELAKIAQERAERFLRQGVTTIEVKSGYGLDVDTEIKMLKAAKRIRRARIVTTFLGAHAIPKEFPSAQDYIGYLVTKAFPRLKGEGISNRVDVFLEDGYFPKELSRQYLRAAKGLGFDILVHADQLSRSGGAEVAVELGARSAEHLVRIDDSDVERLAGSEVTCVLLPSADLYLNCPYPPARALIDRGARVSVATDYNPGSSPSADVALVGVLSRVQMKMTLAETLCAYTLGGAHALGLERDLGSLEAGKFADLCVLEGGIEEIFLDVGRMPVARVYREGARLV